MAEMLESSDFETWLGVLEECPISMAHLDELHHDTNDETTNSIENSATPGPVKVMRTEEVPLEEAVRSEEKIEPSAFQKYKVQVLKRSSSEPSHPSFREMLKIITQEQWSKKIITEEQWRKQNSKRKLEVEENYAPGPEVEDAENAKDASHNHKMAERKRRKTEGDHLNTLRKSMPWLKKKDKVSTLQGTIALIEQLRSKEEAEKDKVFSLQGEIEQLEKKVQKLEKEKHELEVQNTVKLEEDEDEVNKSPRSNLSVDLQAFNHGFMTMMISSLSKMQIRLNTQGKQPREVLSKVMTFLDEFGLAMDTIQWDVHSGVDLTVQYQENARALAPGDLQAALEARMFGSN